MSHEPAPLPSMEEVPLPTMREQAVDVNPEHADAVALKEPEKKKIITKDGEEIELRRLSPEEKAARRRKQNIVMVLVTGIILCIALVIMLNIR
jgi:hypothetical protein